MGQIVASVTGALLLLKLVKILLPEGSIKKYASLSVSVLVVLVMIMSVAGRKAVFTVPGLTDSYKVESNNAENTMNGQIMKEFSRRLEEDMKTAVPELDGCEMNFVFSENNDGSYYISSVEIISAKGENKTITKRIGSLYSIDTGIIHWRKK